MRRPIVRLACLVPLLAALPAAADCIVAPGLPGGGLTMSCDGSPPNPSPGPLDGTGQDDDFSFVDGFLLDTPPGFPAVDLEAGDDEIFLGDGADLGGVLDGGLGDDELTFGQTLAPAACAAAIAELGASDPAAGSIVIAGILYEWVGFETLTPDFVCLAVTEVPALSWPGLLALALLLAGLGAGVLRTRP